MSKAVRIAIKWLTTTKSGKKVTSGVIAIVVSIIFVFAIIPAAFMNIINPFESEMSNGAEDPYQIALKHLATEMNQEQIIVNLDLVRTIESFVVYSENPEQMKDINVDTAKDHLKKYYLNLEKKDVVVVSESAIDNEGVPLETTEVIETYKGNSTDVMYEKLSVDYPQVLSEEKRVEILSILDLVKSISKKSISGNNTLPIEQGCFIYNQPFGEYLEGGSHYGIDLATEKGTPIYAVADGVITQYINKHEDTPVGLSFADARKHIGHENAVVILHDESTFLSKNTSTRYLHNSLIPNPLFKEGDKVKAGNIIGFVGNSGFSTGYHLHFEVIKDNQKIDPLHYFDFGNLLDYSMKTKQCN